MNPAQRFVCWFVATPFVAIGVIAGLMYHGFRLGAAVAYAIVMAIFTTRVPAPMKEIEK